MLKTNPKWRLLMQYVDLMVCADPHDAWMINNDSTYKSYPKTIYLPLAIDEEVFKPIDEWYWKSCFVGSIWVARRKVVIEKIPKGLIELPNLYHKGDDFETALESSEYYNKKAGRYAVNLNLRTFFAGLQLRIFETMAMGRVCLSHKPTNASGRTNLHTTLKNVLWYDDNNQITPKLQAYLNNKEGMQNIGAKAREEVIKSHTHTHRIKSIIANL